MKRSLVIVAVVSACTSAEVNVGSGPGGDAGTGDQGYPAYAQNCGANDGPVHAYSTVEEAAELLTATTWIYCSGWSIDGSTQAGIVFGSDMIFHDVDELGSGDTLVARTAMSTNTWAIQQSSSGQIELRVTTEYIPENQLDEAWLPTFVDSPRKLLVTGASTLTIYAIAP
jgi:hypothetical protein